MFRFSPASLHTGIEQPNAADGTPVRVYSAEKSLADVFKFRHKLGINVAVEALRTYSHRRKGDWPQVLEHARVCRVENVMRPYLEAVM